MAHVGVHEAKTNFSKLLRRVETGEEILIMRGTHAVARLVAVAPPKERVFGADRGLVKIAANFDDPMPDDFLNSLER